ncbi:unnamed protein product [Mytilus coruscus]|uniref:WSC domain-containing protein n=1 Tax=Mytilus coruscus TaxID=42192 RepID=A0A6J8F273_MYTCO|nr:unnamed protein product [Mytilus coruscus]
MQGIVMNITKCFCGSVAPTSISSYTRRSESECNMACGGQSREKCGGEWRLSIHKDCSVLQPYPPHCAEIDCTTSSNKWCVKCTDSLYYKLIRRNCIDKCSSRNRWCWPGSCRYDVAANCNCMTGFKTVKNKFTARCQPIRKPIIDHFQITAVAGNDEKSSSNNGSAEFSLQKNFYGRFQVDHFEINVIAVFQISTISKISRPNFISRERFGITDVDISMKKITISGQQKDLGTTRYKSDSLSKNPQPIYENDNATIFVRESLKNGERSKPLILSRRLSPFRNITVQFKGWIDPNINTGSGIESYEIAIYEVKRISPMIQMRDNKVIHILKIYPSNNRTSINMELPLKTPMLYTVLLTVKDKANNTRRARRFVLYDNSSVIMLSPNHSFNITEVMNHNKSSQLCISWENRFYNNKFKFNNFLHPVRPETAPTSVEGIYDQEVGVLSINGTENVNGLTAFYFTFQKNNENVYTGKLKEISYQSVCLTSEIKNGDIITLYLKVEDIMNHTMNDSVTIYIKHITGKINQSSFGEKGCYTIVSYKYHQGKLKYLPYKSNAGNYLN